MDCDLLIIGGGIAGLSLAAALGPAARITLCEAEDQFGHHASGRSAALYEPRYGLPPLVELAMASGPALRAGGYLSPRGMMVVAGDEGAEAFARDVKTFALSGMSIEEARARVPILNPATLRHAAHSADVWDIDTDRRLQDCTRAARAAGASLRPRCPVTALHRDGAGWRAETPQGPVRAALVVNAAGAWADTVAAMAGLAPLGLRPLRRSVARIPAPAGQDVRGWPALMGAGESWYAKPDAGALIVSPAEEEPSTPHDAFADDMVLAEGLARYEAMVTAPVTRLLASWAGLRTFAPDRLPVVGPDPRAPGFFWLAGQGGYGFQTEPALAALARDLILGQAGDAALLRAFSPARLTG